MFDLHVLTPPQGSRVCARTLYVFAYVAAFVIPINFKTDMTMFYKSCISTFWPHPRVGSRGSTATILLPYSCMRYSLKFDMPHDHILKKVESKSTQGAGTQAFEFKSRLICYISIVPLEISVKTYKQLADLLRNLDIWITVMLIYRHSVIIAYSGEVVRYNTLSLRKCEVYCTKKPI